MMVLHACHARNMFPTLQKVKSNEISEYPVSWEPVAELIADRNVARVRGALGIAGAA
jgi:hypothetical protein